MLAERFIIIGGSLFFSYGAFLCCRLCSAYYDALRCKAFIRIRSDLICYLFIAQRIKGKRGRLVYVAPQDEHKMTVLGLLSHLIVDSLAIRYIFVTIQYAIFPTKSFETVQKALIYLVFTAMAAAIIGIINQSKVG